MKDSSGYDIRQYFEEGPFSHFAQAGYGSIYPALGKALEEGLVTCRAELQDGRPDRKVYSITPTGRLYLTQQLHHQPGPDKFRSDYLVSFLFAAHLEPAHLRTIFDEYQRTFAANVDMLSSLDSDGISPGNAFVRELGIVLYGAVAEYMAENRERFLESVNAAAEDNSEPRISLGERT